ncbi:MAG: helix-turn-helix domain-containing protein, partial [Salibacteraceae bacterium]
TEIRSTKKVLLSKDAQIKHTKELVEIMEKEEPYLDSSLTLRSLAQMIQIHPNQLSWLLNESLGKNFNEYVNAFRIEKFKSLAKDSKNSHITLIGLGYESGFSSKTVFNTYFKKATGITPKQYLKSL